MTIDSLDDVILRHALEGEMGSVAEYLEGIHMPAKEPDLREQVRKLLADYPENGTAAVRQMSPADRLLLGEQENHLAEV